MTDRLIRLTTALAVATVAAVVAVISYRHAYELVRSYGAFSSVRTAPSAPPNVQQFRVWRQTGSIHGDGPSGALG